MTAPRCWVCGAPGVPDGDTVLTDHEPDCVWWLLLPAVEPVEAAA